MTTEDYVKGLVARFREGMDSKEELLKCFCRYGVQLEGWLKGELLCFLDREKEMGRLADFDREVSLGIGRKKVDFKVEILTNSSLLEAWIELKHWLIGYQRGTKYNAQFYFGDPSSAAGIKPDVEKLNDISNSTKFLLILTTANPGTNDWSAGVDNFNKKFRPLYLKSLTDPIEYPSFYFLGLLEISRR